MLPFTATPIPFGPMLLDDLQGIEEWLVIDEFAAGETLWSPDGRYLFVVRGSGVEIHDMQSLAVTHARGYRGAITTMAVNPRGTVLATGAERGEVSLYILPDAQDSISFTFCDCAISAIEFSPQGDLLLIRTEDDALHIYTLPAAAYR